MFIPFGTREKEAKRRFAYVTAFLVLANVLVFIYELYLQLNIGEAQLGAFLSDFAVIPARLTGGDLIEPGLITSMFLHAGLLHIASNMLYLMPFGDNVEDRLGHLRYLLFYIICGIGASVVHIVLNPDSTIPALGASGAVAGVLAGYLVFHPRGTVRGLFFLWIFITRLDLPAAVFIGFWFFIQLFNGLTSLGVATSETAGVAFWAHVGGFLTGLILAPLLQQRRQPAV